MSGTRDILKNAFTDSQLVGLSIEPHTFSVDFELKMKHLIKYQKGFLRLINTAGKRIACVILAVFICLSTVACGVKEIREPIVKELKMLCINAAELLKGTAADDVASLFPSEVSKIIGISHVSKSEKQYIIDSEEKITEFIKLISETPWGAAEQFNGFNGNETYWSFDFYGGDDEIILSIKMCDNTMYGRSKIVISKDGAERQYYISNDIYMEILAFTNDKYYLHNSRLNGISKEFFDSKREKIIGTLNESELKRLEEEIRSIHYETEAFLLTNVSFLKEKDSVYWEYVESGKAFSDPITNEESVFKINSTVLRGLKEILGIINEPYAEKQLTEAYEIWKRGVENHDLSGLFKAHEYIHDYDYYAINYPTRYVYDDRADYQGLDDYFGHLE